VRLKFKQVFSLLNHLYIYIRRLVHWTWERYAGRRDVIPVRSDVKPNHHVAGFC